jgi:hypothetical protein
MVKKIVLSLTFVTSWREIFFSRDILKVQSVMLIKGRILVLFYPDFLGGKKS